MVDIILLYQISSYDFSNEFLGDEHIVSRGDYYCMSLGCKLLRCKSTAASFFLFEFLCASLFNIFHAKILRTECLRILFNFVNFSVFFSRFPFNWRKPIIYLATVSYIYLTTIYLFAFVGCLINFGLGIFLFAISAIDNIKNGLKSMNRAAAGTKQKQLQILKHLSYFVQCHSTIKKLSNRT